MFVVFELLTHRWQVRLLDELAAAVSPSGVARLAVGSSLGGFTNTSRSLVIMASGRRCQLRGKTLEPRNSHKQWAAV